MTSDAQRTRVAAALTSAMAAGEAMATPMFTVAESIAACGGVDSEDLRRRGLGAAPATSLMLRALPVGLAFPQDRPRLRRDAYRLASAAGADEGTALVCVATALVTADLQHHDARTTALRVRQSLLEDAPMALLDRLTITPADAAPETGDDPGAALQLALSSVEWRASGDSGAALNEAPDEVRALAAGFAGAAGLGDDSLPVSDAVADVASRLGAAGVRA